MDALTEIKVFWDAYSAGAHLGGTILLVVAACSVVLFINKTLR